MLILQPTCPYCRANIGNGRLFGLEKDLGLQGNQFQTAVAVFFATYVVGSITCPM